MNLHLFLLIVSCLCFVVAIVLPYVTPAGNKVNWIAAGLLAFVLSFIFLT